MAKNIAEHVAKEAISYIDDREKLKRKIERLYDCRPIYCSHCNSPVCSDCAEECWKSGCEGNVCKKCSNVNFCFVCWQESHVRQFQYVGCPDHPLQKVQLPNGYTVPMCEHDIPFLAEVDETPQNMLEFYGILHKRAKKIKTRRWPRILWNMLFQK